MNFFEKELSKIIEHASFLENPTFTGRACLGQIGEDLRARIEFVDPEIADHYSALRTMIMNRTEGVVDRINLNLLDILGMKQVPGNPNFPHGVKPHIWEYKGKAEWYAFTPTQEDYQKMGESIADYVRVFRPLGHEKKQSLEETQEQGMPNGKTVWITVYKDTLGYPDDFDNLTEICVPAAWLMNRLKAEGQSPEEWFNEYTADHTDDIARQALAEGLILDCSDKDVRLALNKGETLDRMIQNARNRIGARPVSEKYPGKESGR